MINIGEKKITIDNKEYDIPEGIKPLDDDGLYVVDWNLIEVAKPMTEEEKKNAEFRFFNPRLLGQYTPEGTTKKCLGQGFGDEMKELLEDISTNGLDYPLLGYFFTIADGTIKVRVHDGERRWRCMDRMIEKDMMVWSRVEKQFSPAKEVYNSVLCRISEMTDEEALIRACSISETSIKWGDAAGVEFVKVMYAKGKKDDEICKMLNKSKQWLAETYSLTDLDEYCFHFLASGKINRKVALDLVRVKDVAVRQLWLKEAWKNALESHAKLEIKHEKLLQKAELKEELAEAEVEEAKLKGEAPETVAELQEAVDKAVEKTKKRKQVKAASAKPMVKSRNLRQASGTLNALRAPKIKKKLQSVEEMIDKGDTSHADIKTLHILKIAYQCILDGEEDIIVVLKKL